MSFEKRSRSLFTACGRIITPDFFSSEELRAGQGRRPRVHGSDTLWSKGADRGQGEGVETLVTRGVVQAAVSKFNDQPDSRSHSGRPLPALRIRFWEDSFRVVLTIASSPWKSVRNSTFSHAPRRISRLSSPSNEHSAFRLDPGSASCDKGWRDEI